MIPVISLGTLLALGAQPLPYDLLAEHTSSQATAPVLLVVSSDFKETGLGGHERDPKSSYTAVDEAGQTITQATITFGTQFNDTLNLVSRAIRLKIVGVDSGGTVVGVSNSCTIGGRVIAKRNVALLLDGQSTLSLARALSYFDVTLRITNSSAYTGAIECDPIKLRVNP